MTDDRSEKKRRVDEVDAKVATALTKALSTDTMLLMLDAMHITELAKSRAVSKDFQELVKRNLHRRKEIIFDRAWARVFRSELKTGAALQAMLTLVKRKGIETVQLVDCDALLSSEDAPRMIMDTFPEMTAFGIESDGTDHHFQGRDYEAMTEAVLASPKIDRFIVMGPDISILSNDALEEALLVSRAPLKKLEYNALRTEVPSREYFTRLDQWTEGLARLTILSLDVVFGDRVFLAALRKCTSLESIELALLVDDDHLDARILTFVRDVAVAMRESKAPVTRVRMDYFDKQHGESTQWLGDEEETTTTAGMLDTWAGFSSLEYLRVFLPSAAYHGSDHERARALLSIGANNAGLVYLMLNPAPSFDNRLLEQSMDAMQSVGWCPAFGTADSALDLCVASRWLHRHPLAQSIPNDASVYVSDVKTVDWDVLGRRLFNDQKNWLLRVARAHRVSLFRPLIRLEQHSLGIQGPELVIDNLFATGSFKDLRITLVGDLSQLSTDFLRDVARSQAKRVVLMQWKEGVTELPDNKTLAGIVVNKIQGNTTRGHTSNENLLTRIRSVLDGKADSKPTFQMGRGKRDLDGWIEPTELFRVWTWWLMDVRLHIVTHVANPQGSQLDPEDADETVWPGHTLVENAYWISNN